MIVLDTSLLSLAFRRRTHGAAEPVAVQAFRRLVAEDWPVLVPGIAYQELLSGLRTEQQFARLSELVSGFPIVLATHEHHTRAAQITNACRRAGVVASTVDALIAAMTLDLKGRLFSLDGDFSAMAPHCDLVLVDPRNVLQSDRGG